MKPQNKFFAALALLAICVILAFAPKKKIIVIDAAHGGHDHGAVVEGISEKDIVRKIADEAVKRLSHPDYEIYIIGEEDKFLDLGERVKAINSLKPDVLVSLHVNSSINASKKGAEAFVSQKNLQYQKSKAIAEKLLSSLASDHKSTVKDANFFVISKAECAAVTLEMGYLTNESDRNTLTTESGQREIAEKIAYALTDL